MIRSILIISSLLLYWPNVAQPAIVDSLATLVATSSNNARASLYNQIGQEYAQQQEYEQAIQHHLQALKNATKGKNSQNILRAYKELAGIASRTKDHEKALEYALKLKQLAQQANDHYFLGYAHAFLSRIKLHEMDDLAEAEVLVRKTIEHFKKAKYQKGLLSAYNDMAIIYIYQDNIALAIEQYQKALSIAEQMQSIPNVRLIKSNIAGAYSNLEQYDLAEQYNKEALSISIKNKDPEMILYDQLLMGVIHFEKGEFEKALANVKTGGILADSLKDYQSLKWSYEYQLKIYKRKKDIDQALRIAEKAIALHDTINQVDRVRHLAEKESEIKLLLKDQELLRLEKAADRQHYIRNGVIILSVASLAFFYFLYSRKRLLVQLQQKELDHLNSIKAVERQQQEVLKEKLAYKERALANKTMHIIQKNEILSELKEGITSLTMTSNKPVQTQIKKLNRTINSNINFDDDWEKFQLHFAEVHPLFFDKLKQKYPTLNPKDVRFCAYIRMGLSTKEIAQLTGVNPNSIQKARYRLKKKMDLDRSTDLIKFINNSI